MIPEIDDVLVYDAPWIKATALRESAARDRAVVEALRARRFDAAVIFTVFSQNPLPAALLCFLADIPLRLAYCHENPYQLLTHWVRDPDPALSIRHETRRQLDLVAEVGMRATNERLSLRPPPRAMHRVLQLLGDIGLDARRPFVVIHPGATAASRRYPPASFAAAARQLFLETSYPLIFTGQHNERELVETVRMLSGVPSYSLAGLISLEELAALIGRAALLIVNNTGPAHIAAAMGTPVVTLYALTNPQHTPWQVESRVLSFDVPCRNCFQSVCPHGHNDCLSKIAPERVVDAALDLLKISPREKAGSDTCSR